MYLRYSLLDTGLQGPIGCREEQRSQKSYVIHEKVAVHSYTLSQGQVMLLQCLFYVVLLGQRDPSFSTALRSPHVTGLRRPQPPDPWPPFSGVK